MGEAGEEDEVKLTPAVIANARKEAERMSIRPLIRGGRAVYVLHLTEEQGKDLVKMGFETTWDEELGMWLVSL